MLRPICTKLRREVSSKVTKPKRRKLSQMTTIPELAELMQDLMTTRADELAKNGFIERQRKVTGSGFAKALTFSALSSPSATREEVNQAAANAGMDLSTPGLDNRINAKGAAFLKALLDEALQTTVTLDEEVTSVLSRFNGVYVADSSIVSLPDELAGVYQGNNGETDAAVKISVEYDLVGGEIGLWLTDGKVHDQNTPLVERTLPKGALHLRDLGYYDLSRLAQDDVRGVKWVSRYKTRTTVFKRGGKAFDLVKYLSKHGQAACDIEIDLGTNRLPCRLIALPVPANQIDRRIQRLEKEGKRKQRPVSNASRALANWTILITNVSADCLTPLEALHLMATRWQIELLFKLWKSHGHLDKTRSGDPERVLCEFYAKLLAVLLQHWMLVVSCWHLLDRSLHRAAQVIRKRAFAILDGLVHGLDALVAALYRTAQVIQSTCRQSQRASHPLTFQLWMEAGYD